MYKVLIGGSGCLACEIPAGWSPRDEMYSIWPISRFNLRRPAHNISLHDLAPVVISRGILPVLYPFSTSVVELQGSTRAGEASLPWP